MTKQAAAEKQPKAKKAGKSGRTLTTDLKAPKPDPLRAEQRGEQNEGFRARKPKVRENEDGSKDHVYTVASRARWPDGDIHKLNKDAAEVEAQVEE